MAQQSLVKILLFILLTAFLLVFLSQKINKNNNSAIELTQMRNLASLQYELIPNSNKVSREFSSSRQGWVTYENYLGGYAVDYPKGLKFYDKNEKEVTWGEDSKGHLCLAVVGTVVENEDRDCPGLLIYYSIPTIIGKGGMGCGEDKTEIQLRDRTMNICVDETRLDSWGMYYLSHPTKQAEIGFSAVFTSGLSKDLILEILKTFRFI